MRAILALATILVLLGVSAAGALYGLMAYAKKDGPLQTEKLVLIESGTGVRAMATQLKNEGVIGEPYAFMAVVKLSGSGQSLKAGEYLFPAHISLNAAIDKIEKGDVYIRKVTVAEGLTSHDVAAIINAADAMTGQVAAPPEGSVMPDTYTYSRNDDRAKMLARMQTAMTNALDALWEKRAPNLPFTTKEQALALASVVEKETGIGAERARIAGVFVNRLRAGMRLQSDPTVIYAITKGQSKIERVLYAHLETDSPYNTYKYAGIPPGPICNPGVAAIEAVLNPETNDYLYFVADGTGGHVFARTMQEHEANVAKWRAVQKNR
ncbi:MAG: endolytic transglycosylase MltG [Alphaproteobacteria bacterium]|nr:endolytic transglycosylase MltG [Alphaproteobacteria bacterium]